MHVARFYGGAAVFHDVGLSAHDEPENGRHFRAAAPPAAAAGRAARGLDGRGRAVADVSGAHAHARRHLGAARHGAARSGHGALYTLIALYALSPILYGGIQVLGKSGRVYLFVLAAAVSAHTILMTVLPDGAAQYVDLDIFDKLKIFGGHMATFVLGYLLGSYEKEIPNWLLALGAVVLLAVISVGTWVRTVRTGEFNQSFQNQSAGFEIVLASCIFLLCKQTCNRPPRAWVKAVTGPVVALSMAIYLMHNIFLSMLFSVGVSVHSFGSTVGVTLLAFAACFVVTKTVATIRPLCYLATGKTYAEACRSCNWVYTFRRLRGHSAAEK